MSYESAAESSFPLEPIFLAKLRVAFDLVSQSEEYKNLYSFSIPPFYLLSKEEEQKRRQQFAFRYTLAQKSYQWWHNLFSHNLDEEQKKKYISQFLNLREIFILSLKETNRRIFEIETQLLKPIYDLAPPPKKILNIFPNKDLEVLENFIRLFERICDHFFNKNTPLICDFFSLAMIAHSSLYEIIDIERSQLLQECVALINKEAPSYSGEPFSFHNLLTFHPNHECSKTYSTQLHISNMNKEFLRISIQAHLGEMTDTNEKDIGSSNLTQGMIDIFSWLVDLLDKSALRHFIQSWRGSSENQASRIFVERFQSYSTAHKLKFFDPFFKAVSALISKFYRTAANAIAAFDTGNTSTSGTLENFRQLCGYQSMQSFFFERLFKAFCYEALLEIGKNQRTLIIASLLPEMAALNHEVTRIDPRLFLLDLEDNNLLDRNLWEELKNKIFSSLHTTFLNASMEEKVDLFIRPIHPFFGFSFYHRMASMAPSPDDAALLAVLTARAKMMSSQPTPLSVVMDLTDYTTSDFPPSPYDNSMRQLLEKVVTYRITFFLSLYLNMIKLMPSELQCMTSLARYQAKNFEKYHNPPSSSSFLCYPKSDHETWLPLPITQTAREILWLRTINQAYRLINLTQPEVNTYLTYMAQPQYEGLGIGHPFITTPEQEKQYLRMQKDAVDDWQKTAEKYPGASVVTVATKLCKHYLSGKFGGFWSFSKKPDADTQEIITQIRDILTDHANTQAPLESVIANVSYRIMFAPTFNIASRSAAIMRHMISEFVGEYQRQNPSAQSSTLVPSPSSSSS